MTRKDYILIAGIIAQIPVNLREETANAMSHALIGTNPNYDANRFYNACMTGNMGKGRSHKNVKTQ